MCRNPTTDNFVSPPLASALRAEREEFNRRFANQSHLAGGIDGLAFQSHLRHVVDPIVVAVAAVFPERTTMVINQLFDLSLDLFAKGTLGPNATSNTVLHVWSEVLPAIPKLIARDAAKVAGSLTNAAVNVDRHRSSRVRFWLSELKSVTIHCETAHQLLLCGAVLAWRAGLVQFRQVAIQSIADMPMELAIATLGLSAETTSEQLASMLGRLAGSPWEKLESGSPQESKVLQMVGTVGDFRGFGGEFLRPPLVTCHEGVLVASDGSHRWQFLADCYGSLVHGMGGEDAPLGYHSNRKLHVSGADTIEVDPRGNIRWNQTRGKFVQLKNPTSAVGIGHTLAVTVEDSHRVYLLAVV